MNNATLGRRVLNRVTAEPGCLDMDSWGYITSGPYDDDNCGTRACLAGWTMIEAGYTLFWDFLAANFNGSEGDWVYLDLDGNPVREHAIVAGELLGFTTADHWLPDGRHLFLGEIDPDTAITQFRKLVEAAEARAERPLTSGDPTNNVGLEERGNVR